MDTNELSLAENEYDDGVVCFGPVTESQLNRYKRLPRRTVLPSDFELSQSFFEQDEDKKNDQSTVFNENTSTYVGNSTNMTHSTHNFDEEKEEIETTELKQSFTEDSNSKFSSPCFSKCIPNAKLMDTEVINRYIRMGSTSSNDSSLSEDQNKSTFEDATVSFTDAQETESIQDNYVFDETSTCEHFSVSSAIDQSTSINQQNVLDDSNNVCTLIHCSQKDDTDLSICSDSELGDVTEDSIVADEFSVTPGKQRLFDLRVTKQSLRAKALVASAPFMDRIEENATPIVPKVLNSPLILNNISYKQSEIKENLNVLSITELPHGTSIEQINLTSNENMFETSKFSDETAGELLISTDLKNNVVSMNKSVDTMFDETINTNKLSTDSKGMNVNISLIKSDQIKNTLNDMVHTSVNEQSMNIMTNITIPTDVNVHCHKEYLIAAQLNATSTNTSVEDKTFDETMKTYKLSTNNRSMDLNQSLNDTEHKFDGEKSVNIISNMASPKSDVNDYNDEEFSVAMEVDIKSTNTSCVDKKLDDTVCTNKLSLNNQSTDLNKSLNETNIENTLNNTEHKFDGEKIMNIMSNKANSLSDENEYNDEKNSMVSDVDIISISTSAVNKIIDETVYTNKLSINNQSTDSDKSFNETNIKNTLNNTEHKFDGEKSVNIISNMASPTSNVNDYNDEEFSVAMEVDIKSTNNSCVDKELDETVCTNKLSINNQSIDSNKSLNKSNIQNSINNSEHKFDGEKIMNIISNKANSLSNENEYNDEENSIVSEVDIISISTSAVNKIIDETVYTNKLSINNQSTDSDKSFNETNIKNTLNNTEHKFDGEKSVNIISNMASPTSNVNDYNDEEFSVAMEVDIKSTNNSCVDKELDETVCTNKLSINNQSIDSNKSLNKSDIQNSINNSEHKFDGEKIMNIISNKANSLSNENEYNDEENSIVSEVDIISISTSAVNKIIDETVYTNKLSINNQSTDSDKSFNETNIKNTLNNTEHKFDGEKSVNIISNMASPTSNVNDYNDEEFSVAMEVDIKSTNNSCVDKELDETVCTNKLSINNQSIDSNKSLNKSNIQNSINNSEHKFDGEKIMNIMSNKANSLSNENEYNDEENSIVSEVDIISISTSAVNKIIDETVYTNKLSINNHSSDKSLNETNIENTLNNTGHKFDGEKSVNIISNMASPTSDVNDYNDEEFSVAMEVDIKSTNTSCVDKELDETVCTNKLSINNQSIDSNKSLNKSNIQNSINNSEHKMDGEKSINIMSNMAIPISDVNDYNDEEFSVAMEVDIKSTMTSFVDKELDETVCTNRLSINNQSTDLNKSLNEFNIKNTLDKTKHKFDGEKSMNIMSNKAKTSSVNEYNDGENEYNNGKNPIVSEVDIKSINTSIVDQIFDESMLINANKILTDSRNMNCNKSLNETESTLNNTEHKFMNNILNTSVSAVHFDDKLEKSILKNTINSDNSFVGINEVNITCNTSLEDPSCMMKQYLDFEQGVNEMCDDISSSSCLVEKSTKPKESYDDETLENLIEQTLSSDAFNLAKVNENFSNYDGSNLSIIIENKSLETSCNSVEQTEDFVNPNSNVSIPLEPVSIVKEVNDIELLNNSTVVNTVATPSKSEVGLAYGTDVNIQIKAKENILVNCSITDSGLVENKCNGSSMFSDEVSKMEFGTFTEISKNLNNTSTKQIFISKGVNELHSTQNTLDDNNLYLMADQINITDIPNSTAFKLIPETEITQKNPIYQDELLNNRQQDLLDTTKCIDNNLEEFTNLEQMFNFGDNKKEKQVEYKTPKIQKLLDFSIIQQTPTLDNPAKKQKLLNFSIVDQTPILQTTQQKYPNENVINNDSLINFSSFDQNMWNSEVVTKDEIKLKDFQNSSNYSSSNNLSAISAPALELLSDESIKTNTSNFSNSSFDQTITDSHLNLSTYACESNKTQNGITELNNLEPLKKLIKRQIVADKPTDSSNQTIEQNESRQKTFYGKHCVAEASTKSNTASKKNIDSAEFKDDLNQELCYNSNERAIVDFSIIDQGMLENVELKNNTDIMSFESDRNVSNLIEISYITKSVEQSIILSENPITPITSHSRSEKSLHSGSDEINSTALHLEESTILHNNTELLTDIQMNDESLLIESPEKSSIIDSFHSIELDHVQEDNKRKMETTQEYDNNEKKMKVETEMLKTPMSMLYKIKNMFRSSERQPSCVNNTKENNFKSNKCYQKLNFNKFGENNEDFTKPITLKKPEVVVKSKIPCKVTDRSLIKNDELNTSSLSSFNDSIKQKKTIPKFSGVPVLSDVSNSSNRKRTESRIPSKFQK